MSRDHAESIDGFRQPNWSLEADMEVIELGERVRRDQEHEDLGFGAIFDLQYEQWIKEQGDEQ